MRASVYVLQPQLATPLFQAGSQRMLNLPVQGDDANGNTNNDNNT